jgi:hypothetical protein
MKEQNKDTMVTQLHHASKESEQKAGEVLDQLDLLLSTVDLIEDELKHSNHNNVLESLNNMRNIVFDAMSMMQYQDIHRQKIERVINIMRDISNRMSSTLDDIESNSYSKSAKYIDGDSIDDLISHEDIDSLISQINN